jgi:hypothetical protein
MRTLFRPSPLSLTLGLLLAAAPRPAAASDDLADFLRPSPGNDRYRPVLLTRGEGYLVHALPQSPPRATDNDPTHLLLHTALPSGKMKRLLASGPQARPFRWADMQLTDSVPPATWQEAHILGAAADAERLYVLWWVSDRVTIDSGKPVPPPGQLGKGAYQLLVFDLADGERLHTLDLAPFKIDLPEERRTETVEAGPLKLTDKGVSCFETTFEFKGLKLVGQQREKKMTPADAPMP